MLVSEVIQRIQSLYSKGVQSASSRLTPRHIYNKVVTVRSKLIAQDSKKKQKINQWNYQTLSCVKLIQAAIHECPCLPPIGCEVYRTENKLPKPLTNLNNHLIQSVTSLDGTIIFSETDWVEVKYKKGNKYTANKPDYFILNQYLYITASSDIIPEVITITGIWEDPLAVYSFPSYCDEIDTDCTSPLDREFPLDIDMIDTVVEMSLKELITVFGEAVEDLTVNTIDSDLKKTK
jgi:hypothetical protein